MHLGPQINRLQLMETYQANPIHLTTKCKSRLLIFIMTLRLNPAKLATLQKQETLNLGKFNQPIVKREFKREVRKTRFKVSGFEILKQINHSIMELTIQGSCTKMRSNNRKICLNHQELLKDFRCELAEA